MKTYLILRTVLWVVFVLVFFYFKRRALIDEGAKPMTRRDMVVIAASTFLRVEKLVIGYAIVAYAEWRRNNPRPTQPYVS